MKPLFRAGLLALMLGAAPHSSLAQSANETRGAGGQPPQGGQPETSGKPSAPQTPPPSIASSLGPLGDLWGARPALEKAGITFSLTYIGETLGNTAGGIRRGSIYEGRLDTQIDADLEKLLGWSGATFHTGSGRWTRIEDSWVVEQPVGWCAMRRGGELWRGLLII